MIQHVLQPIMATFCKALFGFLPTTINPVIMVLSKILNLRI
jgi:hypothetical protein